MELEHGGDWAGFTERYGRPPIDFSANISPLGLPESAREAVRNALSYADRYPDPLCRKLRRSLAAHHSVDAQQIVCGAGAADLIHRLGTFLRPKRALIPVPSFLEYTRALEPWNCEIRTYPLYADNGFQIGEDFAEHITDDLDLVILCEPNNPTGVTTKRSLLEQILARCREKDALLVVDECFLPFLDDPSSHTLIPSLGAGNLLILRAFTKFYAMAGLRLGYAITDEPGLAESLSAAGQPWPVSSLAQEAGIAALEDRAYAQEARLLVRTQRTALKKGLQSLGFTVIPGEANYLLFFSPDKDLGSALAQEGILIRDCSNYQGLEPGWYRIAVRTQADNQLLLHALAARSGRCLNSLHRDSAM